MPALVNKRLGESGMRLAEGTMVWPFDLKKSRNDCRISKLVIAMRPTRVGERTRQDQTKFRTIRDALQRCESRLTSPPHRNGNSIAQNVLRGSRNRDPRNSRGQAAPHTFGAEPWHQGPRSSRGMPSL